MPLVVSLYEKSIADGGDFASVGELVAFLVDTGIPYVYTGAQCYYVYATRKLVQREPASCITYFTFEPDHTFAYDAKLRKALKRHKQSYYDYCRRHSSLLRCADAVIIGRSANMGITPETILAKAVDDATCTAND